MLGGIPEPVAESWNRVTTETGLAAIAASRSLHRALADWQATLVLAAVHEGASWEEIGEALGTTRQGAWARFRHVVEGNGGSRMEKEPKVRDRLKELRTAGQARLRELDTKWHEEKAKLHADLESGRRRLAEAKQRHARERRAAREEWRQKVAAVVKAQK